MSQKRGKYTEDFKQYAVWLVTTQGHAVAGTARNLGVSPATLSRWKREFGAVEVPAYQGRALSAAEEQETLHSLEEKLSRLQQLAATSLTEKAKLQRVMVAQREQLAGVEERLAAMEKEGDKLLDTCRKAHDRLMALEGEKPALEVELPTLVAERDAGQAFEPMTVENGEPGKRPKTRLALGSVFVALLLLLVVATQRIWTEGISSLRWLESTVSFDSARSPGAKPGAFVANGDQPIPSAVPAPAQLTPEETVAVAALEIDDQTSTDATGSDHMPVPASVARPDGVMQEHAHVLPAVAALEFAEQTSTDATGSDHMPVPASVAQPDGATQEHADALPAMAALARRETAGKRYGVQVGAYREPANLARTLREMQELGFNPVITVRTGSAASLTGVVVGDFAKRADACDIECPLNEMGWETWVRAY